MQRSIDVSGVGRHKPHETSNILKLLRLKENEKDYQTKDGPSSDLFRIGD